MLLTAIMFDILTYTFHIDICILSWRILFSFFRFIQLFMSNVIRLERNAVASSAPFIAFSFGFSQFLVYLCACRCVRLSIRKCREKKEQQQEESHHSYTQCFRFRLRPGNIFYAIFFFVIVCVKFVMCIYTNFIRQIAIENSCLYSCSPISLKAFDL